MVIRLSLEYYTYSAEIVERKTWLETHIYGLLETLRKRNLHKYGPNDLLLSTNANYDRGCAYYSRIRAFLWVTLNFKIIR